MAKHTYSAIQAKRNLKSRIVKASSKSRKAKLAKQGKSK